MTTDLRYPIGRFERPTEFSDTSRAAAVAAIASAPAALRRSVHGLSNSQLDTPYRPDGWTVRQLVHHVADSHVNAYVRHRLALTEDNPTIKPYDENLWAELPDSKSAPIESSLQMLEAMHERWVLSIKVMEPASFSRTLNHPERGPMTLDLMLELYAWHGAHHVAHVTDLRKREGW
jgi:hypothetical protein